MAKFRYLIAGLIACLIHGIALSYTPEKKAIKVSTEQGNQSLQIQLMTRVIREPSVEKTAVDKPELQKAPTEPVVTKPTPKTAQNAKTLDKNKAAVKKVKPLPTKPKVIPTKPKATVQKVASITPEKPSPITEKKPPKPKTETPTQAAAESRAPVLVNKPKFSARPTPVTYPKLARKQGLEGRTMIEVWLDKDGKQIKRRILQSSGHRVLDERALKTIKQWQFSRQVEQGQAIAHRVHIPINFQLQ
ncbi:TonB family protein [Vibrio sp. TRT 21S02]|uniref:energy transducer TonB n=1 Tax=Vibrio sp. TRT 21S02 TaxID=3418507 RepID=UPI003CEB45EA